MKNQIREISTEVRIVDEKRGIVDYVASDETVDSYGDIIRAKGWRFNLFKKNAPFVDSHNYGSIAQLLGQVVDFRVQGKQLIERVQWAVDVDSNELARIGWQMTVAGFLKAVSVGFVPLIWASRHSADRDIWDSQLNDLGLDEKTAPRGYIFIEQEQIELSACVIGANPNALAKAYKADVVSEGDLDAIARISQETKRRNANADAASHGDDLAAKASLDRERRSFLDQIDEVLKGL